MALNFPSNPSENDTYVLGSRTWRFNGVAWDLLGERSGAYFTRSYTGDGSTTQFLVTIGTNDHNTIVTENGVVQKPTTDYTISSNLLTFTTAPANGVVIGIRELAMGGGTGGYGDGGVNVFVGNSSPDSPPIGTMWYDNTSFINQLFLWDGTEWKTTAPSIDIPIPVITGPTSGNEFSNAVFTITNFDANNAYVITVSGGSYSRANGTITWTLPSVSSNTTHTLSAYISSNGASTPATNKSITVNNITIEDTSIIVSNFSNSVFNTGWTT